MGGNDITSQQVKTPRLFVALPVSDEIQKGCEALQAIGKTKTASVRWVDPKQIHLTLVFLGWTDPALQSKIEAVIQEIAGDFPPFTLKVTGLGAFPKLHSPKVIWAGVAEERPLMTLQHALAEKIGSVGIVLESRPYRPHLTLGRVQEGKVSEPFTRWIGQEKGAPIGECPASRVALMESRLRPEGSIYTARFVAALQG